MPELPFNQADRDVRFLDIGVIIGPFGLDGHVRVHIITDFPDRFLETTEIRVGDRLRRFDVLESRLVRNEAVLKLRGVDDAGSADALKGEYLRVTAAEAVALEDGEFYWHEVVGLEVVTDSGESLGKIAEILRTGANDVYVVNGTQGEVLVPAIADVVLKIDPKAGRVLIRLIPGMIDPPTA